MTKPNESFSELNHLISKLIILTKTKNMEQPIDISNQDELKLQAEVGQVVVFKVQGNVTTGYNWFLGQENNEASPVFCTNLTEHGTGEYLSTQTNQQNVEGQPAIRVCGAPGFLIFKYEVRQPGEYKVVLQYKRPWETEPIRTKTITFNPEL